MNNSLRERSYAALLARARAVADSVAYDQRGYASRWQGNLMVGLPLPEIELDLHGGAGRELAGKLSAAHSSAALVINSFGPWRRNPESLPLAGMTGFRSLRFEVNCPTGLGGTPPNLDLLAEGEATVAVESKCTEWMVHKSAVFSSSYDRLHSTHGHSPWFGLVQQLRANPDRYDFLDVAQLVKHALGLLACYRTRELRLIYIYWEPRNSECWPECRQHRAEAEDLANQVGHCSVRLLPISYRELWEDWGRHAPPLHLPYLLARYDCTA